MEFRKIIQFGGNSYVVSLPKKWIINNNLKKGDNVSLEEKENRIIISQTNNTRVEEQEEIEVEIKIDKNNEEHVIERSIFSAYVDGATKIVISGSYLKNYINEINSWLKKYVALEVIEQTNNKIVTKTYIDIKDVNILSFIRRVDNTIKSMFTDFVELFPLTNEEKKENIKTIFQREENIDKIRRFIYRTIKDRMKKPEQFYVQSPLELMKYWEAMKILEQISNQFEDISNILMIELNDKKYKIDENCDEFILDKMTEMKKIYDEVMSGFYKNNIDISNKMSLRLRQIRYEIKNKCTENNKEKKQLLLNIISLIKDLNRLIN
jgi:phosphate uptake regulator